MAESLRELVEALAAADTKCDGEIAERGTGALTEYGYAMRALCDALLTSRAVEAVEVLRAYGLARAADDWGYDVDAEWMRVAALADALAEEVG